MVNCVVNGYKKDRILTFTCGFMVVVKCDATS